MCYHEGRGVRRDPAEACRLFAVASELGDATAQYTLAMCYKNGSGVPVNPAEEVRLLRSAAANGNKVSSPVAPLCSRCAALPVRAPPDGTGESRDPV
jgi:TPR repeat protein